ncbi:MAG TPA: cupin domain-containing protein [Methylomirabilota bacterium]|nr:cupin domain-containing protein [Methylomirabilota bacterium]
MLSRPRALMLNLGLKWGRGGWTMALGLVLVFGAGIGLGVVVAPGLGAGNGRVEEKKLLDNERVTLYEFVFPPGFKGDEHEAPVDEFAYVLDGEFGVVTKGKGKRVVRRGEVEWAPKGVIHYSVNESKKPARVLVVLLKER